MDFIKIKIIKVEETLQQKNSLETVIFNICMYFNFNKKLKKNLSVRVRTIVLNPKFKNNRHVKNMSCLAKDTVNGCFLIVHFAGIKIIGIYNAPSHPPDLDSLLDEIALTGRLTPGEPCIFVGDFNARNRHWLDAQTNAAGILLQNWMDN